MSHPSIQPLIPVTKTGSVLKHNKKPARNEPSADRKPPVGGNKNDKEGKNGVDTYA